MKNFYLSEKDYTDMVNSSYVKEYLNPQFDFYNSAEHSKEELENGKFVVRDGVVYHVYHNPTEYKVSQYDIAQFARFLGYPVDLPKHKQARDKDVRDMIAKMREHDEHISAEERFEMECAFGKGATVVNIITGKTIQL